MNVLCFDWLFTRWEKSFVWCGVGWSIVHALIVSSIGCGMEVYSTFDTFVRGCRRISIGCGVLGLWSCRCSFFFGWSVVEFVSIGRGCRLMVIGVMSFFFFQKLYFFERYWWFCLFGFDGAAGLVFSLTVVMGFGVVSCSCTLVTFLFTVPNSPLSKAIFEYNLLVHQYTTSFFYPQIRSSQSILCDECS